MQSLGFGVPHFNTFFFQEQLWNKSLYFFLPGYLKAQIQLCKPRDLKIQFTTNVGT